MDPRKPTCFLLFTASCCEKQPRWATYGDNTMSGHFPAEISCGSITVLWLWPPSTLLTKNIPPAPFPVAPGTWHCSIVSPESTRGKIGAGPLQEPKPATPLLSRKAALSIAGWFSQNKQMEQSALDPKDFQIQQLDPLPMLTYLCPAHTFPLLSKPSLTLQPTTWWVSTEEAPPYEELEENVWVSFILWTRRHHLNQLWPKCQRVEPHVTAKQQGF